MYAPLEKRLNAYELKTFLFKVSMIGGEYIPQASSTDIKECLLSNLSKVFVMM